jgi:rhodanese-related sulfurtransferase
MDITVEELHQKLVDKESFVFIDVREPYEYDEFNLGARLIPMGEIMGKLDELSDDKNKEIVICCRSGNRSGMIKSFLSQSGFPHIRNLLGGIVEWQQKYGNSLP